jgi:hypothetical protein
MPDPVGGIQVVELSTTHLPPLQYVDDIRLLSHEARTDGKIACASKPLPRTILTTSCHMCGETSLLAEAFSATARIFTSPRTCMKLCIKYGSSIRDERSGQMRFALIQTIL